MLYKTPSTDRCPPLVNHSTPLVAFFRLLRDLANEGCPIKTELSFQIDKIIAFLSAANKCKDNAKVAFAKATDFVQNDPTVILAGDSLTRFAHSFFPFPSPSTCAAQDNSLRTRTSFCAKLKAWRHKMCNVFYLL